MHADARLSDWLFAVDPGPQERVELSEHSNNPSSVPPESPEKPIESTIASAAAEAQAPNSCGRAVAGYRMHLDNSSTPINPFNPFFPAFALSPSP